jgi:hypothetical protein
MSNPVWLTLLCYSGNTLFSQCLELPFFFLQSVYFSAVLRNTETLRTEMAHCFFVCFVFILVGRGFLVAAVMLFILYRLQEHFRTRGSCKWFIKEETTVSSWWRFVVSKTGHCTNKSSDMWICIIFLQQLWYVCYLCSFSNVSFFPTIVFQVL